MAEKEYYTVTMTAPSVAVAEAIKTYVTENYVNGLQFETIGGYKGMHTETMTFKMTPVTKSLNRMSALSAVSELVFHFADEGMNLQNAQPNFTYSPPSGHKGRGL